MHSEDEIEEIPSWKGVPATIILLNAFDSKYNTISVAHSATCRVIKHYLRLSGPEIAAVSVFGTKNTSSSNLSLKSVIDIFPLISPTLDDFKKLLSANVTSYSKADELNMSEVLWHASKMFTNCKKQLSTRSVIILSRLDEPPVLSDQKPTLKRVVDLVSLGIDIKLVNISSSSYGVDQFYKKFLIEAKGRDIVIPNPVWDVGEIEKIMHQQTHRHLSLAKLMFEIGSNLSIGVGVYSLVKKTGQDSLNRCKVDKETNAIVTVVNKTMKISTEVTDLGADAMDVDEENEPKQMPILKSELLFYEIYGGEKVAFTSNEKKHLDNPFGAATLKLLGFKPANIMCKEKWFLKRGYFIFPNESIVEGSTIAFKALHQACTDMSMVAICVLRTRINARTKIVALSPSVHPLGLNVEIGFDVIYIPFVENVRDIPETEDDDVEITDAQKSFMKKMLTSITFDYRADLFENPKIQSEYRAVEAIALDEEELEPYIDTTKPDSKRFEGIQEDLFKELFGPFGVVASKRSVQQPSTSKKAKVNDIDDDLFKSRIDNNQVSMYTVDQLKQILKEKCTGKLPVLTGLKKKDLVDLVYQFCA